MLTNIRIKNFKRLSDVSFELGKTVVLIGPNNSGKTTALQALALWNIGLKKWNEKREGKSPSGKRTGVAINRNDLVAVPVSSANLLWKDLHVRSINGRGTDRQKTKNICIEITVDGVTDGKAWSCGFEFDYANSESFYCRPLRLADGNHNSEVQRMPVPTEASALNVAFLPPMSGLADREFFKQLGEIGVLIGQGQTAQVLRNLCFQVCYFRNGNELKITHEWERLTDQIKKLFGVTLLPPKYIAERAEITMSYLDEYNTELEIASSGRGLQQTLLLLVYLYANPKTVLLLDEPDAHLEILRQRQIYKLLTDVADEQGSQIIAASHSEVVLNEAAGRDIVIAFVGKPHRIDKSQQVLKALKDIGYEDYYMAEQTGWILYLEGSTDLDVLRTFAQTLNHPVADLLERPFVHYLNSNLPQKARDHFFGLLEAKPDLVGVLIVDRLERQLSPIPSFLELMWSKREIENYFCSEEVLLKFAADDQSNKNQSDLFTETRIKAMKEAIQEVTSALKVLGKDAWSPDLKVTDEFLNPLFDAYFKKLNLPNLFRKSTYYVLAKYVSSEQIDAEVTQKLDAILETARKAKPRQE
ncbi:MAG: AAA family ATPase [Chloroherpetonaceae bacterium]